MLISLPRLRLDKYSPEQIITFFPVLVHSLAKICEGDLSDQNCCGAFSIVDSLPLAYAVASFFPFKEFPRPDSHSSTAFLGDLLTQVSNPETLSWVIRRKENFIRFVDVCHLVSFTPNYYLASSIFLSPCVIFTAFSSIQSANYFSKWHFPQCSNFFFLLKNYCTDTSYKYCLSLSLPLFPGQEENGNC